jgi:hypothetical protein
VQADKPFRGLDRFGTAFLSKFQSSEVPAPILEDITFIDTPGILSGEKQRIGRSYDFIKARPPALRTSVRDSESGYTCDGALVLHEGQGEGH